MLEYVRQNTESLGIGVKSIGIWSCSGNVPMALSMFMTGSREYLKCAVLCYGYMLDTFDSTAVADAAGQWGFVNPNAGWSIVDLPQDLPLFIVRAD